MSDRPKDNIVRIEFLLRKVCFSIKKKGRRILDDFDITPPQFDALQYLIHNGELTISELSAKLYQAPSTITDLVDRMEKNNLVERIRDCKDRRVVKVKVLPKGYEVIDKVLIERSKFIEHALNTTEDEDRAQFIKYLETLYNSSLCSQEE